MLQWYPMSTTTTFSFLAFQHHTSLPLFLSRHLQPKSPLRPYFMSYTMWHLSLHPSTDFQYTPIGSPNTLSRPPFLPFYLSSLSSCQLSAMTFSTPIPPVIWKCPVFLDYALFLGYPLWLKLPPPTCMDCATSLSSFKSHVKMPISQDALGILELTWLWIQIDLIAYSLPSTLASVSSLWLVFFVKS